MAVLCSIDGQDEGRKVNQNANAFSTNEATARLEAMGAEAIERDNEARHVESVSDQDALPVQ
jgi:hypothetical protein